MHEQLRNVEAEAAALGGMILDAVAVGDIAKNALKLRVSAFTEKKHQIIFSAIMRMIAERRPVDVLTLTARMESEGTLENSGGKLYLDTLTQAIPVPEHAEYYLDLVRQKYILRRINEIAQELGSEALTTERGDTLLQSVPGRYADIIEETARRRTLRMVLDGLMEEWRKAHKEKRGFKGLATPWPRLNEITCGLQPGIYMLAARPSQGKTTVEDQISEYVASQGMPVARVTMDMTVERLMARTTARKAGVSLPKLNAGYAGDSQISAADEAGAVLGEYPMHIADDLNEVNAICTWVEALKIKHNIQLFTLDYVQQVVIAGKAGAFWSENDRITYISRRFKRMALELKIPVLILSQLNRGSDKDDRIPQLSDMRGSGSLEQDAQVAILLYHDKDLSDLDGKRPQWMDVAKNQDGATGTIPCWFWANYFRYDEAEVDENGKWH